jgi:hypothetical protein
MEPVYAADPTHQKLGRRIGKLVKQIGMVKSAVNPSNSDWAALDAMLTLGTEFIHSAVANEEKCADKDLLALVSLNYENILRAISNKYKDIVGSDRQPQSSSTMEAMRNVDDTLRKMLNTLPEQDLAPADTPLPPLDRETEAASPESPAPLASLTLLRTQARALPAQALAKAAASPDSDRSQETASSHGEADDSESLGSLRRQAMQLSPGWEDMTKHADSSGESSRTSPFQGRTSQSSADITDSLSALKAMLKARESANPGRDVSEMPKPGKKPHEL